MDALHDARLRWELRKSRPASPDGALALAVERHAFMKVDPSLKGGSQATVNMVSATPPLPLMATASSSQDEMIGTLINTNRQTKFKKLYLKQVKTLRIHVQVVPTVVSFVSKVPHQINKMQIQTKTKMQKLKQQ